MLDPSHKDSIQAAVAAWGFAGLSEKTSRDDLVKQIEARQLIGQLDQMGTHSVSVAAWLLAYGIETKKLTPFLQKEATTPEQQRMVLRAVGRLFELKNLAPPWGITDMARSFRLPDTVSMLVDIYLDPRFEDVEFKQSALASAQALVSNIGDDGKPVPPFATTPEDKKALAAAISKLYTSKMAYDRWDATEMLFVALGVEALDNVLGGLKADITLYSWYMPDERVLLPDFAISEICKRRIVIKAGAARPSLEAWLVKGDRMQKAFAILCLKQIGAPESTGKLGVLTGDSTSLEDIFFPAENETRAAAIAAGTIPPLSIGSLAQNAVDAIQMLTELAADTTVSEADRTIKREAIATVFAYTGDFYKLAVQKAFERKKAGEATDGVNDVPPAPAPADAVPAAVVPADPAVPGAQAAPGAQPVPAPVAPK